VVLVLERVEVADDLDAPAVRVLEHPKLLGNVEGQVLLAAQSRRVAVG